ncbi:MAG TPA: VOC family protein [Bryobacteraceae bacterium]|nr:VOC family protein [Bryobacteraceae bacterium]
MRDLIEGMLDAYDRGAVSRRELVAGLAALVGARQVAPAAGSTFRAAGWNHVALRVTDLARSRDFYQTHFGMPVLSQSGSSCFLGVGREGFLALFRGDKAGLDHYCIAIENFRAEAVFEELQRQGLKPRRPAGTDRVYFPDPDGLVVQVSALGHKP